MCYALTPPPTHPPDFGSIFCQILTTRSNPTLFSGHFLNKITKISHSILQPIFLQTHSVRAIYTIHLTGHFFTKSQCSSNPLFVGPFFNNIKKIIHHCFLAIFLETHIAPKIGKGFYAPKFPHFGAFLGHKNLPRLLLKLISSLWYFR